MEQSSERCELYEVIVVQALEDALVKQGKRHVTSRTLRGTFTWAVPGAWDEPAEDIESGELSAIEEMIVALGWEDIMVATTNGTFSWEPLPRD